MTLIGTARRTAALAIALPYVRRELPGWGKLYDALVGTHLADDNWRGLQLRWLRGKLHGYEMRLDLSRWSNRLTFFLGRFYDLATQRLLQAVLRPGDTFVDIGANEGMMALLAARLVGDGGKVIAFEPNPGPRGAMEAAIERNRIPIIDVRPVGVGDADAVLTLTVPKMNSGEGSFGRSGYAAEQTDSVECAVRRGDAELAGETPRLIKIDVEGFEEHVLRGLAETIARSRPLIVTEIVAGHLARADSSVATVEALMTGHGYTGWRLGLKKTGGAHGLALRPAAFTPDFHGDVLWAHPSDPLLAELQARYVA